MKYISTILSVIALGLIGVLFLAQNRQIDQLKRHMEGEKKSTGTGFRIAYFDLDSLQAHYDLMKDVKAEATNKENEMNQSLSSLDRKNQLKVNEWRQKGNSMTQAEGEQAQAEYQRMQQEFAAAKQDLEQKLYKYEEDKRTTIRKRVEDYIKEYNRQKNYTYIIAYDANSFIYNKDTLYNITNELVDGLNTEYKKSK
ncbi:MAG TPA: OmpH family outer membrane protein [Puia sp.]|jgi:outer membrane protein|nr:OmpH family outer membrane protein [Puia sp.]